MAKFEIYNASSWNENNEYETLVSGEADDENEAAVEIELWMAENVCDGGNRPPFKIWDNDGDEIDMYDLDAQTIGEMVAERQAEIE